MCVSVCVSYSNIRVLMFKSIGIGFVYGCLTLIRLIKAAALRELMWQPIQYPVVCLTLVQFVELIASLAATFPLPPAPLPAPPSSYFGDLI